MNQLCPGCSNCFATHTLDTHLEHLNKSPLHALHRGDPKLSRSQLPSHPLLRWKTQPMAQSPAALLIIGSLSLLMDEIPLRPAVPGAKALASMLKGPRKANHRRTDSASGSSPHQQKIASFDSLYLNTSRQVLIIMKLAAWRFFDL